VEKKDRNIDYMNNEGCITDLAFLVMVAGDLDEHCPWKRKKY
jgi:hypothetical protein